MKTVLALCPCWSVNSPSLTLASLAAYLRRAGCDVAVADLNYDLYRRATEEDRKYWTGPFERAWQEEAAFNNLPFISQAVVDEWVRQVLSERPRLVCLSLFTTNTRMSIRFATALKAADPSVLVCIGGPEAFRTYGTTPLVRTPAFDMMGLGEGEHSLLALIRNLEAGGSGEGVPGIVIKRRDGELVSGGEPELIAALDSLPHPDYDHCDLQGYSDKGVLPISWTRGCVGRCAFCFEVAFWRNRFRQKSVDYLVSEMRHDIARYGIRNFQFNDSLVNGRMKELEALCDRLIAEHLNVHWWGLARIHHGMTAELVSKMVAAGCQNLMYGVESASQKVLKLMRKGVRASLADRVIRDTYEGGIKPGVSLLVGFPGEEEEDFQQTVEFVRRNGKYLSFVNIAGLGIMPFTPVDARKRELNLDFVNGGVWTTPDGRNDVGERARRIRVLEAVAADHVERAFAFRNESENVLAGA
jgi:anaerobic magnesium-protoporphyrin IX monomethyl ester cyclase